MKPNFSRLGCLAVVCVRVCVCIFSLSYNTGIASQQQAPDACTRKQKEWVSDGKKLSGIPKKRIKFTREPYVRAPCYSIPSTHQTPHCYRQIWISDAMHVAEEWWVFQTRNFFKRECVLYIVLWNAVAWRWSRFKLPWSSARCFSVF
jgi:hypothetical protein